jgi:hypothetical protein
MTPYPWQHQVISHLCCIQIPHSGILPAPVLLIRLTCGDRSSVCDVHSVMSGGFSLTITPLLALSNDQEARRLHRMLSTQHNTGTVLYIHLDEIQSLSDQE